LPFSRAEIDAIMVRLAPRERVVRKAMRDTEMFWLALFLVRAHFFGEAEAFPQEFTVYVERVAIDERGYCL